VLLLRARHVHDGAGQRLAAKVGEKGAHDACEIDPVGFRPTRPPVDLDARGIDLMADDALALEPAVQPVSFEARFVAGQNSYRQPALGRLGARRHKPCGGRGQIAPFDRETAHLLGAGKQHPELPVGIQSALLSSQAMHTVAYWLAAGASGQERYVILGLRGRLVVWQTNPSQRSLLQKRLTNSVQ